MPRLLPVLGLAALTAPGLLGQSATDHSPAISGSVVDERGAPAAEVEVVLRPYPSDYEAELHVLGQTHALPAAVDRFRSGPDGVFSVSAPTAGPYRLEFGPPRSPDDTGPALPLLHGGLVPFKGSRATETIEVPDPHQVAVRVLDNDSQPVEGALVVANPDIWVSPRYLAALTRMVRDVSAGSYSRPAEQQIFPTYHPSAARTDTEGIARLPLPTENATILVSATGFALTEGTTRSGRAAFRLERDPGVRLRVRGPTGAPAPGVLIRTASARDELRSASATNVLRTLRTPGSLGTTGTPLAVTDDNGEAVVSRTTGAETALELEAADHAFARVSLQAPRSADPSAGQQLVNVRLEAPLQIPGRVVDTASGLPIDGAAIWVQESPGQNTNSSPTGAFDLNTRPAPGGTRLRVTAAGYIPATTDIGAGDLLNRNEVKIGLTPAAPIHGLVTDDAGQPVVGAGIRAEPRGSGVAPTSSFASGPATSGSDGSFRVEEAVYGYAYRLTAQARGYASSIVDLPPLEPGLAVEPVHLVLSKGRRVLGTVIDAEGKPVAEAQVSLLWPLDPSEYRSVLDAPAAAAVTDDRGAFFLPATAPGEYEIRVRHSDYTDRPPSLIEVAVGESDFDLGEFTVVAGLSIHGVVTSADGEPVARATLQARERNRSGSATRTATTDVDGRFQLDGFSSDLADLGVRAGGYPLLVRPGVRTGNAEPVLIQLQPGASLTGRVLDNGGNGAAGIPVRLRIEHDYLAGGDPRLWGAADSFPRRVTDKDGAFRFDRLAAGTWSAEARRDAEGAKLDGIELIPGAEREIELVLGTRNRLTVIVATDVGEPVASARIRLESPGERLPTAYGRTDGSGRSVIDITPGAVTVKVAHDQFRDASRQIQLQLGDNELRFELRPGLEIRGTLRSFDGAPLAQATVRAVTEHSFQTEFHQTSTVADESGAFRLTGLEPLRYNVTARSPGYADGGPDQPIQLGDDSIDGLEIVLEPGASIVGTVTGLTPSELTQVRIIVYLGTGFRRTTPDTGGDFTVDGVAPGTWRVVASKGTPGSERTVMRTVTIEQGAAQALVELPFEAGLRLSGLVFDAGEPLANARLSASGRRNDHSQSTSTDHEGRFVMEGLQPGTYQFTIGRPGGGGMAYRSLELHSDLEGVRFEMEPATATLAGVVIDARSGEPINLAHVTAADAATIGALANTGGGTALITNGTAVFTVADGQFELELGANAEKLRVTQRGYESAVIPISIAPGEHREGLVIRLQPAPVEPPDQ